MTRTDVSFWRYRKQVVTSTLLLLLSCSVHGWSSNDNVTNRRQWIQRILMGSGMAITSSNANAACLPGDLSTDCIGVYKVPIDDASLKYFGTPEALKRFAPDLRYVPPIVSPDSYAQAWDILQTQRLAADDIQQVVSAGRLEEAGIKVLNLVPKVTSSGRVVMNTIENELTKQQQQDGGSGGVIREMRINRLQEQFSMVVALWGELDVTIGQGLRGDMGVSAVAQLQILSSLRDAIAALDDFLATASSSSSSSASRKS